ncbi:uncharacterized protein LOC100182396 [Ciona intestinalis]
MKRKKSPVSYVVVDVATNENRGASQFTYFEFVLVLLLVSCILDGRVEIFRKWITKSDRRYYEELTFNIITYLIVGAFFGICGHWSAKYKKRDFIKAGAMATMVIFMCIWLMLHITTGFSLVNNVPAQFATFVNIATFSLTMFTAGITLGVAMLEKT